MTSGGADMSDNISVGARDILERFLKSFVNLLKEFPKNATDEFVYDDSTLKKIGNAADALNNMDGLFEGEANPFGQEGGRVKESVALLSRLLDELPKNAADEFLYDRDIHQQVEEARDTIVKLYELVS